MKTHHYRRPVTNPQAPDFGFNVDVNPLSEVLQTSLTSKQQRVVEIAVDHLDDLQVADATALDPDERAELIDSGDTRSPVEYAVNTLLYGARPTRGDIRMFVGALKQHLRQSGVLTAAERAELSEVP